MSETTQSNLRIRLGPVASSLIDGQSENPRQDLDDAIQALLNRPTEDAGVEAQLATISDVLAAQAASLKALRDVVIFEQRMTRVYLSSILSDSDEDQHELLAMAEETVEEVISRSGLFNEAERAEMLSKEEAAQTAIRRELDRGTEEVEPKKEPELER